MKLSSVLEAKYYRHPIIDWVENYIKDRLGPREGPNYDGLNITNERDFDKALDELRSEYGETTFEDDYGYEWEITKPGRVTPFRLTAHRHHAGRYGDPDMPYITIQEL